MKRLLISLLSALLVNAAVAKDSNPAEIADAFKEWKTVRFSVEENEGDIEMPAPFILLQRLDANRVVVSCMQEPPIEFDPLPVALGVVSNAEAQRLIDRALAIYRRALPEVSEVQRVQSLPEAEQKAYVEKHNLGTAFLRLFVAVVGANGSHQFSHMCNPDSAVAAEFEEFVPQDEGRWEVAPRGQKHQNFYMSSKVDIYWATPHS